jgi:hypothetical protein
MLHQYSTPLDEAQYDVTRFVFSLCESLLLARALGLEAQQKADRTFFGPNLSFSMLGQLGIHVDEHINENENPRIIKDGTIK